jgi:hypothetical protein
MIIVSGRSYEPVVTRHSRELQQRVEHVVREYRSQHDDVSDEELRSALTLAARATTDGDSGLQRKRIIVGAMAAIVAAVGAALAVGGRSGAPDNMIYWVVPAMAGLLGIVIALKRSSRRF